MTHSVVVTVRGTVPAESMYVKNGELDTKMLESHAVYVLGRTMHDATVNVQVTKEEPDAADA